jgi:hypothetical protein
MWLLDFLGRMVVVMLMMMIWPKGEPMIWPEEKGEPHLYDVCDECWEVKMDKVKQPEAVLIVSPRMAAMPTPVHITLRLLNPSAEMYCPSIEWAIYPKVGFNLGERAYYAKEESDCAPWDEWLDGKAPPRDIVWTHNPNRRVVPGANWLVVAELRQGKKMLRAEAEIVMVGD